MKSLQESLKINEAYDLDKEMELWEKRSKDQFGCALTKLSEILKGYELEEDTGSGFNSTPSDMFRHYYALDGDKKAIARRVVYYLLNYDYVGWVDGKLTSEIDGLIQALQIITISAKFTSREIDAIADQVYGR